MKKKRLQSLLTKVTFIGLAMAVLGAALWWLSVGNWFVRLVLVFLGVGFSAAGLAQLVALKSIEKEKKRIVSLGVRVHAKVTSVEVVGAIAFNGQSPFQILAQWKNPETGRVQVFRSELTLVDPLKYIQDGSVWVFIDPKKPDAYVMDTSFLPAPPALKDRATA